MSIAAPPDTAIFFSLPRAKNPMKRESGDQKGYCPSSVPAIGRASTSSRGRSQSFEAVGARRREGQELPVGRERERTGSRTEEVKLRPSRRRKEGPDRGAGLGRPPRAGDASQIGGGCRQDGRRPGEPLAQTPAGRDDGRRREAGRRALGDPAQLLADVAGASASGPRGPSRGRS